MKHIESKVYGIDLDGVSYDFVTPFSKWLKTNLGVEYNDSDIVDYHWYKCIDGLTKKDFMEEFHKFGKSGMYEHLSPIRGSKDVLNYLMNNSKDVWFITGRPPYTFEQTVNALKRDYGISSDRIIYSSGRDYKSNVVNRLGINVFLDDAPEYATSLANYTNAKVYLMDGTYNQDVNSPKITRVYDWEDFISREDALDDSWKELRRH